MHNDYHNPNNQNTDQHVSTIHKSDLANYTWHLMEATDSNDKPVYTLNVIKDQVTMRFDNYDQHYTVGFGVGCNSIGGNYSLMANVLTVSDIMSTEMFCQELDSAERLLVDAMQGSSRLSYQFGSQKGSQTDNTPTLTQRTSDGKTLLWKGKLTADAKYQQKGETVYWKIDHKQPICPDGTVDKCLSVKPVYYNEDGTIAGEGKWNLFTQKIAGYTHQPNQVQIVRLKRYVTEPSDVKGKQFVYEFDMVVESSEVR